MACWKHDRWARRQEQWARAAGRGGWGGMHEAADRWFSGMRQPRSSGNWAFDEYRADTLRRLEEEERGFRDFLERLRRAKDKEEFDQFLAERRGQASHPPEGQAPHGQV